MTPIPSGRIGASLSSMGGWGGVTYVIMYNAGANTLNYLQEKEKERIRYMA
jgi:hypothetical protein